MAPIVLWDVKYDRPVVDGKITNPITGEIEEASPPYRAGPPAVDCIWHNQTASSTFRSSRCSFNASVDDVFLEIAKHVRDGVYNIVSICASAYSFAIICKTDKTQEEIHEAWARMAQTLAGTSQ